MRLVIVLSAYFIILAGFLLISDDSNSRIAQSIVVENKSSQQVLGAQTSREQTTLQTINIYRSTYGVAPLAHDPQLEIVTSQRVSEMSLHGMYAHTRLDGSNFSALLPVLQPQDYACENLQLQKNSSIEEAIDAWMNSVAHRKCLLHTATSRAAISVQRFGNSNGIGNEQFFVFAFIAANNF